MPLLGTKAFILKSSPSEGGKRPGKFFLQLTNEYFDSREELEERIKFYDRKIWSCRCTGHPNLNYAEAYRNENRILESLSRTFPLVFEAAVLHFVHLSKSPLPPLIDGICRMISEKLFIGEPVEFKVKKDSDIVRGKICHPNGSFDVSTDPNLINFHQYVPANASLSKQSTRYTVKLDSENKLVCNVPGSDLIRLTHVPSKENVRVFIRCNAIRFGVRPESPWVVDKEARIRAGIPDIAYPAEIEAAIMSHTVYSKNMRLTPVGKDSIRVSIVNDSNSTACINGQNGQQKVDSGKVPPKIQTVTVQLEEAIARKPAIHPSVARVLKEVEKNGMHSTHTKYLISRLARELNAEEREKLPEEIRNKVYERLELLAEKRMMASLTVEERKSYLSEKMRRKMLELRLEHRTVEDTDLVRENPIPSPHPIEVPYGIPPSLIGDIFFVCEFFACFSRILTVEEKLKLTFENVCRWLANPRETVPLLDLLASVVKAILQDEMFQGVRLYNVSLVQIPICSYSSPEFARLCLKNGRIDTEDVYQDPEAVELVDLLSENDFHLLTTRDQLRVVAALCHLLLDCECVDEEINRCTKEIKSLRSQIAKLLPGTGVPASNCVSNGNQRSGAKKETNEAQPHTMLDDFVIRNVDETKNNAQRELSSKARLEQMQIEKERKQKQRQEAEECRRLQNLQRLEDKLSAKREALTKMTRHGPLGFDSEYNRYWLFSCFDGIVVEKRRDVERDLNEGPSSWFYYKTDEELNQLMSALLPKGDRESHLLTSLKKKRNAILKSIERIGATSEREPPAVANNPDLIQACRENLRSLELRIASAGLGGVEEHDTFYEKLDKAKTTSEFGDCLLQVQKGVIRRFAAGMFIASEGISGETQSEKQWIEHLEQCRTFSRLYFLTDALDSSVQWSLSVRNARCKICRRLSDSEILLLCDGCNSAYHPGCLRPPLTEVPEGDWLCATCARGKGDTAELRTSRGHGRLRSPSVEEKWRCSICDERDNSSAMMAQCRVCQCCVHLGCHSPPIRSTKRSDWVCWKCRFNRAAAETATSSSVSSTRKRSWESCSNDSVDDY